MGKERYPMRELVLGGTYRHYKGKLYRVLHIARHSETEEQLVIYQALYGDYGIWARPFSLFMEDVQMSDGTWVPRFSLLEQEHK